MDTNEHQTAVTPSLAVYGNAKVTIVILAKNEEHTIAQAVASAAPFAEHIVVMDGHSSDNTATNARNAGAVVYTDQGKGKGAAVRQSVELVNADIVVFMDADGSSDPADIVKLVTPIARGEADLCVGSRFAGGSEELSISVGQLIRTVGNILMNIAINKRWNIELTDTLNGFRAVRREAMMAIDLKEDRHTIEQEMVMKMLRHGYKVINAPTHEYARQYGKSSINIWKEWPLFIWCVVNNLMRKDVHPEPQSQAI